MSLDTSVLARSFQFPTAVGTVYGLVPLLRSTGCWHLLACCQQDAPD